MGKTKVIFKLNVPKLSRKHYSHQNGKIFIELKFA